MGATCVTLCEVERKHGRLPLPKVTDMMTTSDRQAASIYGFIAVPPCSPVLPFVTKIGAARQQPHSRVWIEGTRVAQAGFAVGTHYTLTEKFNTLILTIDAQGKRKVSGKGDKPIIDVTGDLIRRVFVGRDTVTVDYVAGKIVIR